MQHTQNYQLPQWEKEDRIMMEDFNGMTEKIDAGMAEAKSAAGDAKQTALTHKNYVTGTFTSTRSAIDITVGFRPSAVIISRIFEEPTSTAVYTAGNTTLLIDGMNCSMITFKEDGFHLALQSPEAAGYPQVNCPPHSYVYLAFR